MTTVATFGTFDLFHFGHLRLLERAQTYGDRLVVGVSSDALNEAKKGYLPVFSERDRLAIVGALGIVDEVFLEESLEAKRDYLLDAGADVLVMGDDWRGAFDHLSHIVKVTYLPRTNGISTSDLKRVITLGEGEPL